MKFCATCGKAYEDSLAACPHCGAAADAVEPEVTIEPSFEATQQDQVIINGQPAGGQQIPPQQPNAQGYAGQQAPAVDSGSFGWAVLGFCIPLVGLILYLVWKDDKPNSAKMAGMGALVSVIASVVIWVLSAILGVGAAVLGGM